ncbi:MAG: glycerol-3-phosphate dehydrogenase [Arenicella sp.]|jgi:glycerol-3-phosphate dehydrogenase
MKREISSLQNQQFDLLVVGAGVHGACAARDAALRGLKVAMIDMGDLGGATSHNSLKTIHGGIRYLQHLNFKRSLESINEQKYWLETAPHLVKPLPFLMPTYGWGMRGPIAMRIGIRMFECLGMGRNKRLQPASRLLRGNILSKQECIDAAPLVPRDNLTGGALWYDAQVEFADLAVLQLAQQTHQLGGVIANYVKATNIQVTDGKVSGVLAKDLLGDQSFTISATTVLNAAGPWAAKVLQQSTSGNLDSLELPLTKSMNIVTNLVADNMAIGVQSTCASDSVVGDTKRLYFIVPWQGISVIGTTHFPHHGDVDDLSLKDSEIKDFVKDINHAYPSLDLSESQVTYCYQGLSPADNDLSQKNKNSSPLHHSKIIDHALHSKVDGLVSIVSIKWTTARLLAEQAVDLIVSKLGGQQPCRTRHEQLPDTLQFGRTLSVMNDPQLIEFCEQHMTHSMTVRLSDLLLRRSNDLVLDRLDFAQIKVIAMTMSKHFQWTSQQQQLEQMEILKLWLPKQIKSQLTTGALWS